MSDTPTSSPGADEARLLAILADAPTGGLNLDGIQAVTEATGEKWSLRTINAVLVSLGGQVGHEKIRVQGGKKSTHYFPR